MLKHNLDCNLLSRSSAAENFSSLALFLIYTSADCIDSHSFIKRMGVADAEIKRITS